MRHHSYKNLFIKNQVGTTSSNEHLDNSQSQIMEEGSVLLSKGATHGHLTNEVPNSMNQSKSHNNFQYLINNEDSQNLHQLPTDEEIFDQDGGQDSNFVDVDDSSIVVDDHQQA